MIRKHITLYGWVQGVGFRYRARLAADLYGCTGWVRNEWDGSVTMEIQGTEENIDRVILAIEGGRYVKIENMDSRMIVPPLLINMVCAGGYPFNKFQFSEPTRFQGSII